MNIGFDAKRYFHNATGLGNYSRTLVNCLAKLYPEHQYFLFNPKTSDRFLLPSELPLIEVQPQSFIEKKVSALWRSRWMVSDLKKSKIDLYHGLSHEIPIGLFKTNIHSVVTVHDLIFERYPEQYGAYEVGMHKRKIKYACAHADAVIAVSKQTKEDLINWYKVPASKIEVCYQSCDPAFAIPASADLKAALRKAYNLPQQFFLYVGSVIERKNLLRICKAMHATGDTLQWPLVVVGEGKAYKQKVAAYIAAHRLQNKVFFLSEINIVPKNYNIKEVKNLAALYQMSSAFIYPSLFEGFGIPVLEALWSGVPVITSATSCLPETGGNAALYVHPESVEEIAAAMVRIQNDAALRQTMVTNGYQHAQMFRPELCARQVMDVYKKISNHARV